MDAKRWRLAMCGITLFAVLVSGCGGSSSSSNAKLPTSIGKGEGQLNLIAWEGYTAPQWVKPFEQQTGCQVHSKFAGSSDEMVALMRQGGGGQYDMVSASGDASLRLIRGGDVKPVNVGLVPDFKNLIPQLQSPVHNTAGGKHYGVSVQWGANILLYNTKQLSPAPTSWAAIYDPKNKGKITVPDNAIQIADAALYLSKTKPSLGITDPYELTMPQLDAAVALLKAQKPLIKKYWALSSDVVDLFRNGDAVVAAAWPIAASTLEAAKFPAKEEIPAEGATGWADTWMLATKAKHPNCAYLWMKYIEKPQVQAEQAVSYGETPANKLACPLMDKIQAGACHRLHADAPSAYFNSIKFWKTPISDCGNGKTDCTDYTVWLQRWQTVKG